MVIKNNKTKTLNLGYQNHNVDNNIQQFDQESNFYEGYEESNMRETPKSASTDIKSGNAENERVFKMNKVGLTRAETNNQFLGTG